MVLLNTGTHGTSREIYSEDADDGTRTIMLYGPTISQSDCRKTGPYQLLYNNRLNFKSLTLRRLNSQQINPLRYMLIRSSV